MPNRTDLTAAAADGTPLAVSIAGDGPPLLLIPGLGASRRVYAPILPLLAATCRTIVYDPRGIGDSGMTEGPWSMSLLADDAVRVLDAAGVERAAVFGASMGGMVAQQLAIDHGDRVFRLILAATNPGGVAMVRPAETDAALLMGRGATTPGDAYRLACTVLYAEAFRRAHPEFVEGQIEERSRHPVRALAFAAQAGAVAAHAAYERLAGVSAPTLVVHGAEDRVSPVANAYRIAERIPGAELVVLPGHGHLFFHEAPGRAADLAAAFVNRPA